MKKYLFILTIVILFITACSNNNITNNIILEDINIKTDDCDSISLIFFQSNLNGPYDAGNKMICYDELEDKILFKYNIGNAGNGEWNGINVYIEGSSITTTTNLYNENQTFVVNGVIAATYFNKNHGTPLTFTAIPVLIRDKEITECKDRTLKREVADIEEC